MPAFWPIPVGQWKGGRVHIVGGGASLKGFNAEILRGDRIIAVNNAGLDLVPFADILFYADDRWLQWNAKRLRGFKGLIVTRNAPSIAHLGIKLVNYRAATEARGQPGLSRNPEYVSGQCGGSTALNLAYLMGGNPIHLWGFDMKPGNYHADHKTTPEQQKDVAAAYPMYIRCFERMAKSLAEDGVEVVNMNPDSALTCFRKENQWPALSC